MTMLVLLSIFGADPEKPLTLAEDELAVLADPRSPDWLEVAKKYHGKVIKLTGKVLTVNRLYPDLSAPDGLGTTRFNITVPGKKATDPELSLLLVWSKHPSTEAVKNLVEKRAQDLAAAPSPKKYRARMPAMTIYGRAVFTGAFGIVDVATDPKVGGVPYVPKETPPARLKPKK